MSEFSEFAVSDPEHQNGQPAEIAPKRRSAARLPTDARPSRDGSEQFGSGTHAHSQI